MVRAVQMRVNPKLKKIWNDNGRSPDFPIFLDKLIFGSDEERKRILRSYRV